MRTSAQRQMRVGAKKTANNRSPAALFRRATVKRDGIGISARTKAGLDALMEWTIDKLTNDQCLDHRWRDSE